MSAVRSQVGWALWPLAAVAVLGHLGLGVLAVVEYAHLDWLSSEPYEFTAVGVVAASAVLAVAGAVRLVWPAVQGHRALRRLLRSARRPLPTSLRAVAEALRVAGRVQGVATGEAFAVTYGLLRPRILCSTGLVAALDEAELTAVLAHERHHLYGRDPLRLLGCRLLADYGWFLPLLRWWARRVSARWELAADRTASASAVVAAVAGALLKLADLPVPAVVAAVNPMGDLPERIAHLEGRAPVRRARLAWLLAGASLANLAGLSAAGICCFGLGVAMAGGMA